VEGDVVVDLWGGHTDGTRRQSWRDDTLCVVWSASKGIMATAVHILVERGELDIDVPISRYWPEYGGNGKESITLRQVMSHTAGVPFIDADLSDKPSLDWGSIISACEQQSPEWTPGTQLGYHAVTYGYIVGEVIQRITGLMPGEFIQREITEPFEADFYIGLPESEDSRVAEWITPASTTNEKSDGSNEEEPPKPNRTSGFLNLQPGGVNTRHFRAAQVPAGNGITNARGFATIYRPLALGGEFGGRRILNRDTIERANELQATGPDAVLNIDNAKRAVGYKLMWPEMAEAFGKRTFGHGGLGGSMGCADPDARLSFGYVMNVPWAGQRGSDPRGKSLAAALYSCLNWL
jgi:CubicO group peptidase (beta-lactamase class C family)